MGCFEAESGEMLTLIIIILSDLMLMFKLEID